LAASILPTCLAQNLAEQVIVAGADAVAFGKALKRQSGFGAAVRAKRAAE
jgi:hypothetical protein